MKGIIKNVIMGADKTWCEFTLVGNSNKYMISFGYRGSLPKKELFENFVSGAEIKIMERFASIQINGEKHKCRGNCFIVPDKNVLLDELSRLRDKFCVIYKECVKCPCTTVIFSDNEVISKQCNINRVVYGIKEGNENGFVRKT